MLWKGHLPNPPPPSVGHVVYGPIRQTVISHVDERGWSSDRCIYQRRPSAFKPKATPGLVIKWYSLQIDMKNDISVKNQDHDSRIFSNSS